MKRLPKKKENPRLAPLILTSPEIAPVLGSVPDFKLTDQNGQKLWLRRLEGERLDREFYFYLL